jgi:hypothetical protein
MPMISMTPVSDKDHGFKGTYTLVKFGTRSIDFNWEVDFLRISGEILLKDTALLSDSLAQPAPVVGKATMILEGTWRDVGEAKVTVSYQTDTRELTIKGEVTYRRDPKDPSSTVKLEVNDKVKLGS